MKINIFIQKILPQHWLSKLAGKLAESKRIWLKNSLIKFFLSKYSLQMQEAVITDPYKYNSFNALFTRKLQPQARIINETGNILVSPADGEIAQLGYLKQDVLLTVKNKKFTLSELLGGTIINSRIFLDGAFVTIYLAPVDYHRVHMPFTGNLMQMLYVPGSLFSVNTATANAMVNLFGRNERVISLFNTEYGQMVVILVGAMIVGGINTSWAGDINIEHAKKLAAQNYPQTGNQAISLNKGEELGYFKLGSTVIVLLEKEMIAWQKDLVIGQKIQFGQSLGQIINIADKPNAQI